MKKFDFHKIPDAPAEFFLMKKEEDYSHLLTPDVVKRFQDEGERLYRAHQKYTKEVIAKVVNFQRFPTLEARRFVNAPKMSAHHRGIYHF